MESVEITVREGRGYLTGLPPEAAEALAAATSFRPAGYQYTTAYKRKRTNGYVKLVQHNKFPAGLLPRITRTLREKQVPFNLVVEDQHDDKPDLHCEQVGIEQRWYQDEAVEAAILNPRGVFRHPTGSGKTATGTRVIAAKGKHALIVVPTIDLLYQYKRFLEQHLYVYPEAGCGPDRALPIGQLGDGTVDPQPVTVATCRTAAKALSVAYERYEYGEYDDADDTAVNPSQLREWIQSIGTLIVDEAHILGAQTVYDIATKLPAPNKYGMSASPWRDDGADLMIEAATGEPIHRVKTKVLVDEGYLVPPIIRVVSTAGHWQPAAWGQTCSRCGTQRPPGPNPRCPQCGNAQFRSEFTDAYRHEIVENPRRNRLVAEIVAGLEGPTLVLVKQVKHGRLLQSLIPDSRFLSGRDLGVERVEALDAMRDGQLRVIIATTIADLGLDLPILRNLVLAGGGKSSTRHLQRIGRTARPYPGKDCALIVDLDDGHVHKWFKRHAAERRRIEKAEWSETAIWI